MGRSGNKGAGVSPGARLYSLLGRRPELTGGDLSVPFEQLSTATRADWDRIAAALLAHDSSAPDAPVDLPRPAVVGAEAVEAPLAEGRGGADEWMAGVRALLEGDDTAFRAQSVATHLSILRRLVGIGQPWLAFDFANRCAQSFGDHAGFQYYRALALSRAGNTRMARQIIIQILDQVSDFPPQQDPYRRDALALSGKLAKQRLLKSARALGPNDLDEAIQGYRAAWEVDLDPFPGINLATLLFLAGQDAEAREIAGQLRQDSQLARAVEDLADYWAPATVGEALLITGEFKEAERYYRLAVQRAAGHTADIVSMRDNVELIGRCQAVPREILDLFALGPVLVFAGHRVDPPDTPPERRRFPSEPKLEKTVAVSLGAALERIAPVAVYCGGASGSDLLLAEQAIERGIEVNLVLPFEVESFCEISVDYGDPDFVHWRQRFDQVVARAILHQESDERYVGDDQVFVFGTEFLQGLTILRARSLNVAPKGLVLIDEASHHGIGGTHWFAEKWEEVSGIPVEKIDLAQLRTGLEKGR